MLHNRVWTLKFLVLLAITTSMIVSSHAAPTNLPSLSSPLSNSYNPYPECPPNNDAIWVRMDNHGWETEDIINVPFEVGFDEDDADDSGPDFATDNVNYVTGVL